PDGISLKDIQSLTSILLKCGTSITEINTIRKHIDDFKGGGIARILAPARVITLILSDVLGDSIDMIASGPTAADPSTFRDAWEILQKYQISDQVPNHIRSHLINGVEGKIAETLKPGYSSLEHVTNIIVGNNRDAITAADETARRLGLTTRIMTTSMHGEAALVGQALAEEAIATLKGQKNIPCPACQIAGGETTVTVRGNGMGGRNQELALGAVKSLASANQIVFVSLATDGGDGITDAAGAVSTNETYTYGLSMGLEPLDYLQRNDSYHYFERIGDLIKTGPTMTNVNDLVLIFSF
ncbi:MAG: glycerate kinase type-2 family protein, partial [Acidobacteriaceae bacterium]